MANGHLMLENVSELQILLYKGSQGYSFSLSLMSQQEPMDTDAH